MEEAGGGEEEVSAIFLPLERVVIVEKGDKDDDRRQRPYQSSIWAIM